MINISGNEITLFLLSGKDQEVIEIYVYDLSHFGTTIFG